MARSQLATAEELVRFVRAGDSAAAGLLSKDVVYKTLGLELSGHAQVLSHLTGTESGHFYRQARWSGARMHGDAALMTAEAPDNSPYNSKILLFGIRGDQVASIEEQLLLPLKRRPETTLALNAALKDIINAALVERKPMLVAHVDEDGQPAMSFRGSIQVLADDQLGMWVRNPEGRFIRAIARNPKVALMYRDNDARATFQFEGRARVTHSQAVRQKLLNSMPQVERDHDFAKLGTAVVVELDRVEGYAGVADGGVLGAVNMRRA